MKYEWPELYLTGLASWACSGWLEMGGWPVSQLTCGRAGARKWMSG